MKPARSVLLFAFSALCAAQLQDLPTCAKPCASSLPANCNLDVKCICSDQAWITGISCCVKNACPTADQEKTLKVASQLCDTVKVTLPSAASCPASSAPLGASSATVAGKGTASSAVSQATMMASSAMPNMSGTTATGSPSNMPTSSTVTSSTSAQAATGAALVLDSNIGAVGAVVAALALL